MASITTQERSNILKLVVGMFNAAPGAEYLNEFVGAYQALGNSYEGLATALGNVGAFQSLYPASLTTEEKADKFLTTLGLQANVEAQEWVQAKLNAGEAMSSVILQALVAIIETTSPEFADAQALLNNKAAVAEYYSVTLGKSADDLGTLQGVVANVKADSDVSTPEAIDALIPGGSGNGDQTSLTVGLDTIVAGTAGQTFTAGLAQGPNGNVSNTFDSGDSIIAKGDGNSLHVDLTASVTGGVPVAPSVSAITKNIQVVEIRNQFTQLDLLATPHGNMSTIDAERMLGVKEWWSVNSRSDLQIEDVRSRPEDTTIGMRDTDPEVGLFVYFDPEQIKGGENVTTALTLSLVNRDHPDTLGDTSIEGVSFKLNGETHVLTSAEIAAAQTYPAWREALEAAAKSIPALAGVSFVLNPDNTVTLIDAEGGTFEKGSWQFVGNQVPADGALDWKQTVGVPEREETLVETNIKLDNVGRTSQGGDLDVGSLGDGGVAVFNVEVDRSSWLTSMSSTEHLTNNAPGNGVVRQYLEEVYAVNKGTSKGNLTVGTALYPNDVRHPDGRVDTDGLSNVRVFDASAFAGKVNLGAELDDDVVGRYLADATESVLFDYTMSAQNDTLNLLISDDLDSDPDFALNVDMGAGDDRFILEVASSGVPVLKNISVDGGTGTDTIVVRSDVGMTADNTFKSFANFENYEIEGGSSDHNFTTLNGVKTVVVATDTNSDTTLIDLPSELAAVSVSGKNQTLGNQNNSGQYFGNLDILAAKAAELTVSLDNTARLDGLLDIDTLTIADRNATDLSAVRTLNIESNGARNTYNEIDNIDALRVNTFNLSGTQDLKAYIDSASNWTAVSANRDSLTVDGSALTGDLHLLVNTSVATVIDGTMDRSNTFTGTAGSNDVLQFTNYADPSLLFTTTNTKISGFETLVFGENNSGGYTGGVEGSFNNGATTGVQNYFVDHFHGDTVYRTGTAGVTDDDIGLELINLGDKANVGVYTGDSYANLAPTALTLRSTGALSELNVDLTHTAYDTTAKTYDVGDWDSNAMSLEVGGYRTINLDVDAGTNAGGLWLDYGFNLVLLDRNGLNSNELNFVKTGDVAQNWATQGVAARELVVTGGNAAARNGDVSHSDELDLYNLDAALETIDLSGYNGQVWGSIDAAYQDLVTDVKIVVGSFDIDWTVNTAVGANQGYNTVFEFTTAGSGFTNVPGDGNAAATWTINDFVGNNTAPIVGTINSHTILDVSDLGISAYNQLRVTYDGADTWIHAETEVLAGQGYTWEIKLTGGDYSAAGNLGIAENFIFA